MYERAQQQAAASDPTGDGASGNGAGTTSAEEDVIDAEVVDEGK